MVSANMCGFQLYLPGRFTHFCGICAALEQCQRRWADVVQMMYECFMFAGNIEVKVDVVLAGPATWTVDQH